MSKCRNLLLIAVAGLVVSIAGNVRAEVLFTDNFDGADATQSDFGLNQNLAARQAGSSLGTQQWSLDYRTASAGQQSVSGYVRANAGGNSWGTDMLGMTGNTQYSLYNSTIYPGHTAIINYDFATASTAAAITAAGGFTVRFDFDPVAFWNGVGTANHGQACGIYIGGKDATESTLAINKIPGREDPSADYALYFLEDGRVARFSHNTGADSLVYFDNDAPTGNDFAKAYTAELRVETNGACTGTASATLWMGEPGTKSIDLTQIDLSPSDDSTMAYTITWDGEGKNYIGFFNYLSNLQQPGGSYSYYYTHLDNLFVYSGAGNNNYVPEPCTTAMLVAGLVGLLAYAWRKRK